MRLTYFTFLTLLSILQFTKAQTSTCLCSKNALVCNTPGSYNFETASSVWYTIESSFKETCVKGIAFVPKDVKTQSQCDCQSNQKGHICENYSKLGQTLYYPMLESTKNGQSPPGQYCFFGDYSTCQTLQMQGTFYKNAQHCFMQTIYQPVYKNSVALPVGNYTQEAFCGLSQLPFGYLTLNSGQANQTVIQYTSTGLNTNGVWFMPETDGRYSETESICESYLSGSATLMPNWMYQSFNQETSIPPQLCNSLQSLAIKKVAPSQFTQCTFSTQILDQPDGCFQIQNCSSIAGFQGTYQYADTYFQLQTSGNECVLNGTMIVGTVQFNTNQTGLFYSTRNGSCQYAYQNTSETSSQVQSNCYFLDTQGQSGSLIITGSEGVQFDFKLPGILETIVAAAIVLTILVAICLICNSHGKKEFEHTEFEGTDTEMMVYAQVTTQTHTIANVVMLSTAFVAAILSVTVYEPVDKALNYYFVGLTLAFMVYHSISHQFKLQQSPLIDNIMLSFGVVVSCYIQNWNAWLLFPIGIYAGYQEHKFTGNNIVKSIVLVQNLYFMVYALYFYVSMSLDNCNAISSNILDWIIYGASILTIFYVARKQSFSLLIVSVNLCLSTGYMSELFNLSYCDKGPWTKAYMSTAFITSIVVAFYALALFAIKHKKSQQKSEEQAVVLEHHQQFETIQLL